MPIIFRPGDSTPLDDDEDRRWFEMRSMGRARFVAGRTGTILANTILPVAFPVWAVWWVAPASREFLLGRFTWIPLAIGVVLVAVLGAAHALDTWRSYEKRSALDDDRTPFERLDHLQARTSKYGLIAATLSTAALALEMAAHVRPAFLGIFAMSAFLGWRSVYMQWRARRITTQARRRME
jgi:hypothetical protein